MTIFLKNNPYLTFVSCVLLCLLMAGQDTLAMDRKSLRREFSLKGNWKFNIGDQKEFGDYDYNDKNWVTIYVPDFWENQGFPGYDGFAWYRLHFNFRSYSNDKTYYLKLGQIDDVDEVYFNGKLIGSTGRLDPNYQTAYGTYRLYAIPSNLIRKGKENVIAVRVYDQSGGGGIYHGDIGILSKRSMPMLTNLSGYWKFSVGDEPGWKEIDYQDKNWSEILVPLGWEGQGYPYHDGFAWYRKKVKFLSKWKNDHLILVLGRIDDEDEVFFNGSRIGSTGLNSNHNGNHYKKYRFYYIPPHLINWNHDNQIAVRVYDQKSRGGIYEGPVGIITRKEFLRIRKYFD